MLEIIPEDVKESLKTNGRTISMDAPISSEEETPCMMSCRIPIRPALIKPDQ